MTAFVGVEIGFYGLPAGIPYGIAVLNIDVLSVVIIWNVVIAITRKPEEFGVFVKGISAAGVGYQCEKILISEVIDPGQWCFGCCDDVFLGLVVKMSEFHAFLL